MPGTRTKPTTNQDLNIRNRSQAYTIMGKLQARIFLLCLLILHQCLAMPLSSQCIGETLCTYSLKDYYNQIVDLPKDINTRSLASWVYQEKIDLNRKPQVIFEAQCQDSQSGGSCNSALGLETIPVTLRMPVLRKNAACFPLPSYSVEFENITIAICCQRSQKAGMEEEAQCFLRRFVQEFPAALKEDRPLPVSSLSRKVSLEELHGESLELGQRLLAAR
ncbi:hypothetical protein GOODEAATRI_019241 [Goodea atripinnis]|uniref:Interleukin-17N n=1 Tax=Goodea atripinnis TaxID=208336 RepID=A0ABV0NPV8_9TELE